jgi:hypothetical protein
VPLHDNFINPTPANVTPPIGVQIRDTPFLLCPGRHLQLADPTPGSNPSALVPEPTATTGCQVGPAWLDVLMINGSDDRYQILEATGLNIDPILVVANPIQYWWLNPMVVKPNGGYMHAWLHCYM